MTAPITVYVVDDHEFVRQALVVRLCLSPGVLVVGETGEVATAIEEINALQPAVALVEPKRSDGRGLQLIDEIAHAPAHTQVLALTSYPSEWEEWAAHRAGASDYLLKDISSTELLAHIQQKVI